VAVVVSVAVAEIVAAAAVVVQAGELVVAVQAEEPVVAVQAVQQVDVDNTIVLEYFNKYCNNVTTEKIKTS